MIQNIVILLIANTILPQLPISPFLAAPLPLVHLFVKQTTVYEHMNLTRIHKPQQFKRAFRQSLKVLHPDRGGDQLAFSKVKNLKKIMEQEVNYYDTLNITDIDLEYNIPFKEVVQVKQKTYYVEAGIYYFIVLLYVLAYTIQQDMRPARKILLPLIIIFAAYQFFIHFHPQVTTVIDLIHNKLPIFIQKTILKTTLSTFISIIRTKFSRRLTKEKILLKDLDANHTEEEYKGILNQLVQIYQLKTKKKMEGEKSWGTKIRSWISTLFTLFVVYSMAKGFFGGSSGVKQHDL